MVLWISNAAYRAIILYFSVVIVQSHAAFLCFAQSDIVLVVGLLAD